MSYNATGLSMAKTLSSYMDDPRRIARAIEEAALRPPPLHSIRDMIARHRREKANLARDKWIPLRKNGDTGAGEQRRNEEMMTAGSRALLHALWEHHADKLRFLEADGKKVVHP